MISGLPNVYFDELPDVINSLVEADILITDRSGIALEYAFGTYRPVLFVDTPLKISNPNWQNIAVEPIENFLRSRIGISILPDQLSAIAGKIEQLMSEKEEFKNKLTELGKEIFFNSPQSYTQGLDYILQKVRN
jgi:YidC/Oxa1 family membrane protein insertase